MNSNDDVSQKSGSTYSMAHEWVWPIRRACMHQDGAFFFKQSAAFRPEQGQALRCPDGVLREFREMPELAESVRQARDAMQTSPAV